MSIEVKADTANEQSLPMAPVAANTLTSAGRRHYARRIEEIGMAKDGFRVFDSDMHIMEPPDLWERYIDPEFRDRAPRGRTSENVRDLGVIFPNVPSSDAAHQRHASSRPQFQ